MAQIVVYHGECSMWVWEECLFRCCWMKFGSIKFSRSVVSNSLQPHEPQHARPPCPSPAARIYPNTCPLSRWCHPTISSSVIRFSSYPQSFPASESFPVSQLFASGGQSFSISPSNEHPGLISFRMDWLDLLAVQGTLKSLLQYHSSVTPSWLMMVLSSTVSLLIFSELYLSIFDRQSLRCPTKNSRLIYFSLQFWSLALHTLTLLLGAHTLKITLSSCRIDPLFIM